MRRKTIRGVGGDCVQVSPTLDGRYNVAAVWAEGGLEMSRTCALMKRADIVKLRDALDALLREPKGRGK